MTLSPSQQKLQQLRLFVECVCTREPSVRAVIAIGSVAAGRAAPGSDIDAIVFLDPLDLHAVPAEAVWFPETGAFHGIFAPEAERPDAIQFDFLRLDFSQWRTPTFVWPEPRRAELATGTIVYDGTGEVGRLIHARTRYTDETQRQHLDEAVTWLDQLLSGDTPTQTWERHGAAVAFDRLNAAYDWLGHALFALKRQWRPWRNREIEALLALPWLPPDVHVDLIVAMDGAGHTHNGYTTRVHALRKLFDAVLKRGSELGIYTHDPIDEAFIRHAEEPGRDWNMTQWNRDRALRNRAGT
jgi:predicted nucleotidyltransferase